MRIGVLVTGNTAVRAAHSLAAHDSVEEVVVVGPARSKNFKVVKNADNCDVLVGTGPTAPAKASRLEVPLIWDGETSEPGVAVWGAAPPGLALALAARETDPSLVAVAHPDLEPAEERHLRFPDPVGSVAVADASFAGRPVALGKSETDFAACLVRSVSRSVTIIDHGGFLSGICLAAGIAAFAEEPTPVWGAPLAYLQTATAMGLVMAEG